MKQAQADDAKTFDGSRARAEDIEVSGERIVEASDGSRTRVEDIEASGEV